MWKTSVLKKITVKDPIMIEGLPGIGNVGKIVMDFLVEKTKATKIIEYYSHLLPNSVFIGQNNLVELPKLEVYHKKIKGQDFLFLTGDVQPVTEEASYTFCELIVDNFKKHKGKYIITLGGIGLNDIPDSPVVYITGNDAKLIETFKSLKVDKNIYGVVGPILGISGLLLGVSQQKKVKAVSLLAETFGHPVYLGLKGARAILTKLNTKFAFGMDLKDLEEEIKSMDTQVAKAEGKHSKYQPKFQQDVNYIG